MNLARPLPFAHSPPAPPLVRPAGLPFSLSHAQLTRRSRRQAAPGRAPELQQRTSAGRRSALALREARAQGNDAGKEHTRAIVVGAQHSHDENGQGIGKLQRRSDGCQQSVAQTFRARLVRVLLADFRSVRVGQVLRLIENPDWPKGCG